MQSATEQTHSSPNKLEGSSSSPEQVSAPTMQRSSAGVSAFYDGPKGRQYDTGTGATGAAGPQRSMSDLDDRQKASVRAACRAAVPQVQRALAKATAAKSVPDRTVTHAFKLTGDTSDDNKALDKVIANYNTIAAALAGDLSFEGEDSPAEDGMVTIAYVYVGFVGLFDGSIHICFPGWDQLNPAEQAATIVHELSHKKCGTDDNAYIHEGGKWADMSTKDAVNNAASYEYLCLHA